ncbi:acyl-CoA carboxylase epsilon subunit [Spirillospora albida]|uniref:acyl-CoA carboxylase epsilon subunit n=1 Tax=Spirillospora albida TaxID=58123 RepID=UPI0004C2705E|nr:acyl-CoA carboxylase epsilon subunit [Spirillospora albida]
MTEKPFLQIVRGDATPEEIAALVAVLAARPRASAPAEPAPPSRWADRANLTRLGGGGHGPGAWRARAFPH